MLSGKPGSPGLDVPDAGDHAERSERGGLADAERALRIAAAVDSPSQKERAARVDEYVLEMTADAPAAAMCELSRVGELLPGSRSSLHYPNTPGPPSMSTLSSLRWRGAHDPFNLTGNRRPVDTRGQA